MKRGGYIQRKTPLRAKTGLKRGSWGIVEAHRPIQARKRPKKKRTKLPSIKILRTKCDKLCTPVIKKLYPYSILSGAPTEVAHHHVHKSKSNALRYYIPNLIPLTNAEHQALHNNESYYASKIVSIRGIEWFQDIERMKRTTVKTDRFFYMEHLEKLKAMLE